MMTMIIDDSLNAIGSFGTEAVKNEEDGQKQEDSTGNSNEAEEEEEENYAESEIEHRS